MTARLDPDEARLFGKFLTDLNRQSQLKKRYLSQSCTDLDETNYTLFVEGLLAQLQGEIAHLRQANFTLEQEAKKHANDSGH